MILNTGRSDLRTLFNLLEKKCREEGTDFCICKIEDGYKVFPGTPDLGVESKLQLIELPLHGSVEDALIHHLLFREWSRNENRANR